MAKTLEEKRAADRAKAARWRAKNPEKAKEAKRRWSERNPDYNSKASRAYYERNKEAITAQRRTWREANKERLRIYNRERGLKNLEENLEKLRLWRDANPQRVTEINRRKSSAYARRNPHKRAATQMARHARKLRATPAWANRQAIEQYYLFARYFTEVFGIPFHVDHQVPLRGALVCGLHVEHNLGVLPAAWNISKGNRCWPDMPE